MKRSTKFLIAGLVVAATAGTAYAAKSLRDFGPGKFGQRVFDRIDADKDGAVALDEFMAALASRFDEADGNRDGSVDKAEVIVALDSHSDRARRRSGAIADMVVFRLDMDDSGSVARSELENRARKLFALADFNDDGKVEKAELRRMGPPRGMAGFHRAGFHGPRWGWHRFGGWWRGADDRGPRHMDDDSAAPQAD